MKKFRLAGSVTWSSATEPGQLMGLMNGICIHAALVESTFRNDDLLLIGWLGHVTICIRAPTWDYMQYLTNVLSATMKKFRLAGSVTWSSATEPGQLMGLMNGICIHAALVESTFRNDDLLLIGWLGHVTICIRAPTWDYMQYLTNVLSADGERVLIGRARSRDRRPCRKSQPIDGKAFRNRLSIATTGHAEPPSSAATCIENDAVDSPRRRRRWRRTTVGRRCRRPVAVGHEQNSVRSKETKNLIPTPLLAILGQGRRHLATSRCHRVNGSSLT